jgi:hypothetical protein
MLQAQKARDAPACRLATHDPYRTRRKSCCKAEDGSKQAKNGANRRRDCRADAPGFDPVARKVISIAGAGVEEWLRMNFGRVDAEAVAVAPLDGRDAVRKAYVEVLGYFKNHVHRMAHDQGQPA